jgi:predicted Zn-dependent protease with MMP-like domain
MSPAEFDQLVEEAIATIPARFRKLLKNVVIIVKREPPYPELLGLHESNPPFPDKITIFQGPHERSARTRDGIFQLIQETVIHEIGHYLGMDELRVQRMERARRRRAQKRRPLQ